MYHTKMQVLTDGLPRSSTALSAVCTGVHEALSRGAGARPPAPPLVLTAPPSSLGPSPLQAPHLNRWPSSLVPVLSTAPPPLRPPLVPIPGPPALPPGLCGRSPTQSLLLCPDAQLYLDHTSALKGLWRPSSTRNSHPQPPGNPEEHTCH